MPCLQIYTGSTGGSTVTRASRDYAFTRHYFYQPGSPARNFSLPQDLFFSVQPSGQKAKAAFLWLRRLQLVIIMTVPTKNRSLINIILPSLSRVSRRRLHSSPPFSSPQTPPFRDVVPAPSKVSRFSLRLFGSWLTSLTGFKYNDMRNGVVENTNDGRIPRACRKSRA